MREIRCSRCKGKGTTIDWIGVASVSIIAPLLYFMERDDIGVTREICSRCDGKGYIEVEYDSIY